MKKYLPRVIDQLLGNRLKSTGALVIEGPKWCGKTTSCEQQAKSAIYIDDPETKKANLEMAELDPYFLLQGDKPRLIDEWQLAPNLWNAIRRTIDKSDEFGLFLLTGSSVPVDLDDTAHTGTGRFSWILMRPMSLYESSVSNGSVSLSMLFNCPQTIHGVSDLTLKQLAEWVCRGGWPRGVSLSFDHAMQLPFDYIDSVIKHDMHRVDGINRNETLVRRFFKSYARNQGAATPYTKIAQDIDVGEGILNNQTVSEYVSVLTKLFIIEDLTSWNPNIRSRSTMRQTPVRYFVDPSIATAALGATPADLLLDLNTFGLFYETLAIRDLRIYAQSLYGTVHQYHDHNGLECDAVVSLRNGKYGLIEIKLGGDKAIESAAASLKKLENIIIQSGREERPSFLMILVGVGKYAYRRKDGIYIVPIGCLKN